MTFFSDEHDECLKEEYRRVYRNSTKMGPKFNKGEPCQVACEVPNVGFFLQGDFPKCNTTKDFECSAYLAMDVPIYAGKEKNPSIDLQELINR